MMALDAGVGHPTRAQISERTLRKDRWWLQPAIVVVALTAWVTYATVRVFMQSNYWVPEHHYLTPFYSPCVSEACVPSASHFGQYQRKASICGLPRSSNPRGNSAINPTVPAGRCGRCGNQRGSRYNSPSLMTT